MIVNRFAKELHRYTRVIEQSQERWIAPRSLEGDLMPRKRKPFDELTEGGKRARRCQDRKATGEIVLHVVVNFATIETMLDHGFIDEDGSRDRRQIAKAYQRIVSNALVTAANAPAIKSR
jgi:hypothetical protein